MTLTIEVPDRTDEAIADVEEQLSMLFSRIRTVWKESAEQVHPDLQPAGYKLISAITRLGTTNAHVLADMFDMDKSVVSRQIRMLEEFGLVEAADRRGGPGTVEPLLVQLGRDRGHPGFQFDSDGTLLPGLSVALSTMRDAGWDDLSIALWFGSPQGSANGRVPAAVIRHDPVLVINAAHSSAAG